MEFSIGDQVAHPKHGAGQITDIEQLELVDGFKRYYVIEVGDKGLTLRIPIRKSEELGVRPVISSSRLDRVLETLRSAPQRLPASYQIRQTRLQAKLKTGRPLKIAELVRDLTWRKRQAKLSITDMRLLKRGRELLALEIALVTNRELFEAHNIIDTALISSSTPA